MKTQANTSAQQEWDERDRSINVQARHPQTYRKSYHPTGNASADAALAMIDRLTGGRAFSYLIIGGCSMLANLLVFSLVYYRVSWPANQRWRYALAFVAASEVSILANFFPNDAITFRR